MTREQWGKEVRKRLIDLGWTRKQLTIESEVSWTTLERAFKGTNVSQEKIDKVSKTVGVKPYKI